MIILAIETSCDETGVAIVQGTKTDAGYYFDILGSALLSQAALHAPYGGVYPNLAKREHEKNLPLILKQALEAMEARFSEKIVWGLPEDFFSGNFAEVHNNPIDAIAVTTGPGLEPALWTGITFAEKLAKEWNKPLIPTNHMEGHLVSSLVQGGKLEDIILPVLGLLISGGHTEFVCMKNWFEYDIIGKTLDDAVGEAFDKVARMLELPYPGGPHISKQAELSREQQVARGLSSASARGLSDSSAEESRASQDLVVRSVNLPRPMIQSNSCDMSFSGLKTAALYALRDRGGIQKISLDERADFAREFEDAVTDVLVSKTRRALKETSAKTCVIGGGVAANTHIRRSLESLIAKEFPEVAFRLPELAITGDNAIMIAEAALLRGLVQGIEVSTRTDAQARGNLSLCDLI